jgi:hypothetical protein
VISDHNTTFLSAKVVPRQWDINFVVSKLNELSAHQCSPNLKTAVSLSSPLLPALQLPSRLLPSLEEDERDFETEERWPVNTAVSKINASVARRSPMSHAAPALSKSRMVPPATGENMPKPARSPLVAILPARHGIRPTTPVVRDKMPVETAREQSHASYPNMASPGCILSFLLKADTSNRHITVSVTAENERSVSSPDTWTAPALSESVPVCLSQACSVSSPQREETR